jgi:amylosucrase
MMGYVCYPDRFAGDLNGVAAKIPYLKELGVTYLHLMPLLKPRPGANDGGYAVMDYRAVRDDLGAMADLADLAAQLRAEEISLCIDLVCNHTAKEHAWAQKAMAGDPNLSRLLPHVPRPHPARPIRTHRARNLPRIQVGQLHLLRSLRQMGLDHLQRVPMGPQLRQSGRFWRNARHHALLANQGVEVLRLDAVAFMWKRLGTDCENQPEAHAILQAFRALSRIAAPGLLLKAEAIVPPPQLVPYLGRAKRPTRNASGLSQRLHGHAVEQPGRAQSGADDPRLAANAAHPVAHFLAHLRALPRRHRLGGDGGRRGGGGLNGYLHRTFLSDFYSGRFPNTFARGATFQFNPRTNDRRISGSCASLAGLEVALEQRNWAKDLALRRILLIHSMILAFGGMPLLYMGDEIGLLNDDSYLDDPNLAGDNRWLHRPCMDWELAAKRDDWRV